MPKARFTELFTAFIRAHYHLELVIFLILFLAAVYAMAADATLDQAVGRAKQVKAQEMATRLANGLGVPGSASAGADQAAAAAPAAPEPPVLKALYGVGEDLRAEIVYDGKLYSLGADESSVHFGGWRFATIVNDGVMLTKSLAWQRKSAKGADVAATASRDASCRKLKLGASECFFLAVPRGGGDSAPPVFRVSSGGDTQARYLASQLPFDASAPSGRNRSPLMPPMGGEGERSGRSTNFSADAGFPGSRPNKEARP